MTEACVIAVARDGRHRFSKTPMPSIRLLEGVGVEGDAHSGEMVQHRSRVAVDPRQPNLRQVHLIACELFEELATQGFDISSADLGENITTRGIDLLRLPRGARLRLGKDAEIEITGLRNPCCQIEAFHPGLLSHLARKQPDGVILRKAGVMAVVSRSGVVSPEDPIAVQWPAEPHEPLDRV